MCRGKCQVCGYTEYIPIIPSRKECFCYKRFEFKHVSLGTHEGPVIYGEPLAYIEAINRDPSVPRSVKLFTNVSFALFLLMLFIVMMLQMSEIFNRNRPRPF